MKTETASAVIARPSVRFEHLIGAVTLVERRLAAEPEGGVALLECGLAVAGAREALVGIGVARGAIAVGVALIGDGISRTSPVPPAWRRRRWVSPLGERACSILTTTATRICSRHAPPFSTTPRRSIICHPSCRTCCCGTWET